MALKTEIVLLVADSSSLIDIYCQRCANMALETVFRYRRMRILGTHCYLLVLVQEVHRNRRFGRLQHTRVLSPNSNEVTTEAAHLHGRMYNFALGVIAVHCNRTSSFTPLSSGTGCCAQKPRNQEKRASANYRPTKPERQPDLVLLAANISDLLSPLGAPLAYQSKPRIGYESRLAS